MPQKNEPPKNPIQEMTAGVANASKQAADEHAHRMAMDALGIAGDPLKAAVEKVIPGRVDQFGNLTKDGRSI